jgi:carboxylesterase
VSGVESKIGFVLCHGFTGQPLSMQPWADYLTARGYTVEVPLLPGHGTTWQDLNTRSWPEFYDALEASYLGLRERCAKVFVGGLSMGGTLALRLAELHSPAGLVLVNPALQTHRADARFAGIASRFIDSVAAIGDDIKKPGVSEHAYSRTPLKAFASTQRLWRITRRDLGRITCPILLARSIDDHVVVGSKTSELIHSGANGAPVTDLLLANSYHVATLDNDAGTIFEASVSFARSAGQLTG